MAINSAKLLPSSTVRGSLVKTPKNFSVVTLSEKSIDDIKVIRTKVIEVEKIFKGTLAGEKKELDRKKKEENREGREREERRLETPKSSSKSIKDKMPKALGMGIFGWIKNFIGNILLGYFATRLIDHLPKLMPMINIMGKAADFLIDFGGKFLDGFVTFIDVAYKAYDWTRGALKKIGGDGLVQNFDRFIKAVDVVITMLTVAALSKGLGLDKGFGRKGKGRRGGSRPRTGGRPRVTQGRGGTPRRGPGGRPRVTGAPRGGFKPKFRGPRGIPILGTIFSIFDFAERKSAGQTNVQAGVGVGGGILGSIAGAALAATLFPEPASTAAGLLTLGILGTLGYNLGGAGADKITGAKYSGGGRVGVPKRALSRAKTKKQKSRIVRRPTQFQIIPGSDVGGEENLEKNYNPLSRLFEEDGPAKFLLDGVKKVPVIGGFVNTVLDKLNPSEMIKSAGEKLFGIDFFGPILGIATQILLGQKPRDTDFKNVGYGINMLIQEGIVKKKLLGGVASAYAEGGLVDSKTLEAISSGGDISDWVAKTFKSSVNQESGKIISDIQSNISVATQSLYGGETGGVTGSSGFFGAPGGMAGQFSPTGIQGDIYKYLLSKGLNDNLALGIMANIHRESGFKPGISEYGGGPGVGLFQYSSGGRKSAFLKAVPDYATNWKGQIDFALKDDVGPQYTKMKFDSPQAAADWWMKYWERPAEYIQNDKGPKIHAQYLAGLKQFKTQKGYEIPTSGSSISLGKGYGSAGGKLAGELGRFIKSKLRSPEQFQAVTEHPEFGGIRGGHAKNSYHYSGRAIDIGAYAHEQGPILAAIQEFNRLKGIKPVELLHAGNEPKYHSDHVHAAYASGGMTHDYPHLALLGEEGTEIVVDADSAGPAKSMLLAINQAKGFDGVMKAISDYAPYDHMVPQTIIVEDEIEGMDYEEDDKPFLPSTSSGQRDDPFEFLDYQG